MAEINLNDLIRSDTKAVTWLSSEFANGGIYVDNSFQRRSVWVLKNKVRLIETIVKGFPMPEIYLWENPVDPNTGQQKYSVVDGQQRLTAIREYISDAFSLKKSFLDPVVVEPSNKNNSIIEQTQTSLAGPDYIDLRFTDLPDYRKQQIWSYSINTRVISAKIQRDQIVEMFLRLNETDKSLNPQELRNAEFNGEFISKSAEIADLEFWKKWQFFPPATIRRMGDVQFVSSLLIFLRFGLESEVSQRAINRAYDLFNDEYQEAQSDFDLVASILNIASQIFEQDTAIAEFFATPVHFYPLFIVIFILAKRQHHIEIADISARLKNFSAKYSMPEKERPEIVNQYRQAATEGTQKRANREMRVNKLMEWLES